jgi:hypothetical protein
MNEIIAAAARRWSEMCRVLDTWCAEANISTDEVGWLGGGTVASLYPFAVESTAEVAGGGRIQSSGRL